MAARGACRNGAPEAVRWEARQSVSTDDVAEKVRFLSSPAAYDPEPTRVTVKETHMSWVFLTEARVYKLKKPLHEPHLDFRSLAARERNCREEVRLNRRLAPDIYLGVVALTHNAEGQLELGGDGTVVDWLVEMRRLPQARMLDHLLIAGKANRQHVLKVVELLARFYPAQHAVSISPADYVQQFRREQAINADMLTAERFALPRRPLTDVLKRVDRMLTDGFPLLAERVDEKRIIDGHGDLRPEHVCLIATPAIIDCLEFSSDLRRLDPYDEIAFLGLECALLGAPWVGPLLLDRLKPILGPVHDEVLEFYWAYRACLRARQAVAHLDDHAPRSPEKWRPLALAYIALADAGLARTLEKVSDGALAKRTADRFGK